MKNRYQMTYHPSLTTTNNKKAELNRTQSYVDVKDKLTGQTKQFHFKKKLGEGYYGFARLFTNGDDKIVVKTPFDIEELHELDHDQLAETQQGIENEMMFMSQAYPDLPYFSMRMYPEKEKGKNEDGKTKKGYYCNYRFTMPFIGGVGLRQFVKDKIDSNQDMATLMLKLTQELQRLHSEFGIIHGDVGARNVLVEEHEDDDDYDIHFLDFGLSYSINGYAKVNFEKSGSKDETSHDMAPERIPNRKLKARPTQDVYSLAKTMRKLIKGNDAAWIREFYQDFPVIRNFIVRGLRDWKDRPSLESFIQHLEANLDWTAHLKPSLNKLIHAIESGDRTQIEKQAQRVADKHDAAELVPLIHHLLLSQRYDDVEIILNQVTDIPLNTLEDDNTCLHIAASQAIIDPEFFAFLYQYVNKNCDDDFINQKNGAGDTVLHAATETGNIEVIKFLLTNGANPLLRNDDDNTAVDIAKPKDAENKKNKFAVKISRPELGSILDLASFIAARENSQRTPKKNNSGRLFTPKSKKGSDPELTAARHLMSALMADGNIRAKDLESYQEAIEGNEELNNILVALKDDGHLYIKGRYLFGLI